MCRHAAYVGPGIALSELLSELDHGLVAQAYQARELLTGVVCADGYGVAWYDPDTGKNAARYAYPGPIWSDKHVETMAPYVRSSTVVAAVRNATVAGSNTAANCAPFRHGPLSLSHNGYLEDFGRHWRKDIVQGLSDEARGAIAGDTDSEHIFALLIDASLEHENLPSAVQSVCRDILERAAAIGKDVQLNLLASDGEHVVATRAGSKPTQNSLYVLQDGEEFPGAIVIASEPLYDDPEWEPVATDTLLVAQKHAPLVRMRI